MPEVTIKNVKIYVVKQRFRLKNGEERVYCKYIVYLPTYLFRPPLSLNPEKPVTLIVKQEEET